MYIDSHCHLDFPDLARNLGALLERMRDNEVSHALCVSVNLEDFPRVRALADFLRGRFGPPPAAVTGRSG